MTLHYSQDCKYVKINDKVYQCATRATQCNASCNAADNTSRSVACVAHIFRCATLQRCVCQAAEYLMVLGFWISILVV